VKKFSIYLLNKNLPFYTKKKKRKKKKLEKCLELMDVDSNRPKIPKYVQ
jgi:hypothetical protein